MLLLLTAAVATSAMPKPHATPMAKHGACDRVADIAAVVADPSDTITVSAPQNFVLVLRTVADGGFGWRLHPDPANDGVFAPAKMFSIDDATFTHVENPSAPHIVGGQSASYFGFRVLGKIAATKTLTFDEVGPGRNAKPTRSRSFNVTVQANPSAC